jgi:hypothetical protein
MNVVSLENAATCCHRLRGDQLTSSRGASGETSLILLTRHVIEPTQSIIDFAICRVCSVMPITIIFDSRLMKADGIDIDL